MIPLLSQIPPAPPALLNFPTLDRSSGLSSPRDTNHLGQAPRDRGSISFEDALDRAAGRRDRLSTRSDKDQGDHGLRVEDARRDRSAEETEGISSEFLSGDEHLPEKPEISVSQDSSSSTTSTEADDGVVAGDSQENAHRSSAGGTEQGGMTSVGSAMGTGAGDISSFIPGELLAPVGAGVEQQTAGIPAISQSSNAAGVDQTKIIEGQLGGTGEIGSQDVLSANREADINTASIEVNGESAVIPDYVEAGTAQVDGQNAASQSKATNNSSTPEGKGQETRALDSSNSVTGSQLVVGKGSESGLTSQDGQTGNDASRQSKANILEKIQLERVHGGSSEPAVSRANEVEQTVRLVNTGSEQGMGSGGRGSMMGSDGASLLVGQVTASASSTPVMQVAGQSGELTTMLTPGSGEASRETTPAMTQRVVRGLSTLVNQNGGVMNMRLSPPELGDLRVQMTVVRSVVTAQFQATTPEAQAMLEKSISVLRTSLESQGLTVERLSVQLNQPANTGQAMGQDQGEQSSNQERQNAGGGASRGHREGMQGRQDESQERSSLFSRYVQEHQVDTADRVSRAGVSL